MSVDRDDLRRAMDLISTMAADYGGDYVTLFLIVEAALNQDTAAQERMAARERARAFIARRDAA